MVILLSVWCCRVRRLRNCNASDLLDSSVTYGKEHGFISVDGEILARKDTRLCAKCQRKVSKTVKRARNMGILGHIDEFVIQDSSPLQRGKTYHKQLQSTSSSSPSVSEVIL